MPFVLPSLPVINFALGVLVAAPVARAQRVDALPAGVRVALRLVPSDTVSRVRADRVGVIIGTIVASLDDSVVVRVGALERLAIPRREIQHIDVSRGRSRVQSALDIGLLAGLFAPLFAEMVDARRGSLQLAAEFALSGAFAGALLPEERWRRLRE